MRKVTGYLVVSSRGDMRVRKSASGLAWDEVAYKVTVNVPDSWGRVRGEIELTMPDAPAEVLVDEEPA